MDLGQDANSGLQPVMPQQPITSGTGPIILAPTEKKTKRWLVIIGVVLFLVAIGTGVAALVLTKSKPVLADVTKAYIEYFVYGTEGENQVDKAVLWMSSDDFAIKKKLENASSQESSEYFDKLSSKYKILYEVGKDKISADLLDNNTDYLDFYKAIMQTLNSDFLIISFNNNVPVDSLYNNLAVEEDGLLEDLDKYASGWYEFYAKVKGWGCMLDGAVNYNCLWGIGEENKGSSVDVVISKDLLQRSKLICEMLRGNMINLYMQGVDGE